MRPRPTARLASVALLLAAGCVAPAGPAPGALPSALEPLTGATFAFGEFLALRIPSFDGTPIHVDLQLPEGEGPFPLLLEYTPYTLLGRGHWATAKERGVEPPLAYRLANEYVPRGYAVAVAHVRGTGESGGCLTVGGPEEGKDGYAIVEALAAEPWSNGKVALLGTSYDGTTPIETAVLAPPHLTTIVPISAVTEWYRYYFENGEQRVNGDAPPGSSYTDPLFWMAIGSIPGQRTGATSGADDARCVADYTAEYWLQDDYNSFWEERNIRKDAANVTASVLYAQGFRDENVATTMFPDFWVEVNSTKRAWLAQHGHGVPQSRRDFHEYLHRWLDHFLLGKRNGALDLAPVLVEDDRGRWRTEADWPPADVAGLKLFLADGGGLSASAPDDGRASYRDDGTGRADPSLEGVNHLRFVSEPLEAPLLVAGAPLLHLEAAADAHDTQFAVLVYDRTPEGVDRFLTRGYLDARHRESLAEGRDLVPGERVPFEWTLHPRDHFLDAGHRIVVVVKSSDRYVIPDETRAGITVFLGGQGSWISLPALDPAGRTFSDEAPRPAAWGASG